MKKESAEIDLRVPEKGNLQIPSGLLNRLNVRVGGKVRVKVSAGGLSARLKRLGVTDEEIEQIAELQLEPNENVVKFLMAESSLARASGFKQRARSLRGGF